VSTASSISAPASGPPTLTAYTLTASNTNADEYVQFIIFLDFNFVEIFAKLFLQSWTTMTSTRCRWDRNIKGSMVWSFNVLCLRIIQLLFRVHIFSLLPFVVLVFETLSAIDD
jgi:hypothetical protein